MPDESKSTNDTSAAKAPGAPWWKSVLLNRWVLILVVGSLVVDCAVLVSARKSAAKPVIEPEYTAGKPAVQPTTASPSGEDVGSIRN